MNPHPDPLAHLAGLMNLAALQLPSMNSIINQTWLSMLQGLTQGFPLGNGSSTPSSSSSSTPSPSSSNTPSPSSFSTPSPSSSDNSYPSSTFSSASGISSASSFTNTSRPRNEDSSTPRSAPGPVRTSRTRVEYCNVCKKNITAEGKRSQGPRRHVIQFHLKRPLFFCPYYSSGCENKSNYDITHVRNHIKRMHKVLPLPEPIPAEKHTYEAEEERWFQLCFGMSSENPSNEAVPKASEKTLNDVMENAVQAHSTPAKAVKKEVEDEVKENVVEASSTPANAVKMEIEDDVKEIKKEEPSAPSNPLALKLEADAVVKEEVIEESCPPANPLAGVSFSVDKILNQ